MIEHFTACEMIVWECKSTQVLQVASEQKEQRRNFCTNKV